LVWQEIHKVNCIFQVFLKRPLARCSFATRGRKWCHMNHMIWKCQKTVTNLPYLWFTIPSFQWYFDNKQPEDVTIIVKHVKCELTHMKTKLTPDVGHTLKLASRLNSIQLIILFSNVICSIKILTFTTETKWRGINVRDDPSGEIVFYMKGSDTVMNWIVLYNIRLEEECENMARKGLRILVIAKRPLTVEQYYNYQIMV
jgi:hypothetical protein